MLRKSYASSPNSTESEGAAELDRRIREQEALDISIFRNIAKEEKAS